MFIPKVFKAIVHVIMVTDFFLKTFFPKNIQMIDRFMFELPRKLPQYLKMEIVHSLKKGIFIINYSIVLIFYDQIEYLKSYFLTLGSNWRTILPK